MYELIKHDGTNWQSLNDIRDLTNPSILSENKGKWVPRVIEDKPTYDQSLSYLEEVSVVTDTEVTVSYTIVPRSPEIIAEELEAANAEIARALKLSGVEYTDTTGSNPDPVMCSATKEDMWGLNSVNTSISMGSPSENFWFDNGNKLVITPANAGEFMNTWAPFRRSFFE